MNLFVCIGLCIVKKPGGAANILPPTQRQVPKKSRFILQEKVKLKCGRAGEVARVKKGAGGLSSSMEQELGSSANSGLPAGRSLIPKVHGSDAVSEPPSRLKGVCG